VISHPTIVEAQPVLLKHVYLIGTNLHIEKYRNNRKTEMLELSYTAVENMLKMFSSDSDS
jgi:hypothetical protein